MASCSTIDRSLVLHDLFSTNPDFIHAHDPQWESNAWTPAFVSVIVSDPESPDGPVECQLMDISATQVRIASDQPFNPGRQVYLAGSFNHEPWGGQFCVTFCTPADAQFEIRMDLTEETVHSDSSGGVGTGIDCLALVGPHFHCVGEAYRTAKASWSQLGRTVRTLITKAAAQFPDEVQPVSALDQRESPRRPARLGATMILDFADQHRRVPMQIVNVSESGLGGRVPTHMIDEVTAAIHAGDYMLHAGLPVMIAFGTEPDTLWMPSEIVHCTYQAGDGIHFGVQFLTPGALQFFGA